MLMILPYCKIILAFIFDQLIGDPVNWPHPVILMGKGISYLEKKLNLGHAKTRRLKGILLNLILVIGSYLVTFVLLKLLKGIHPLISNIVEIYLISTTLAGKSLLKAGNTVLTPLKDNHIELARERLGWFVSRDTIDLPQEDIVRGTIETLAENFVDGLLSPLFYAIIGGAPLAMAFKAISTLDSMVGYKNEKYKDFGWFSARTDDWANLIPARLSVFILLLNGLIFKLPVRKAFMIWKRDADKHPSPNGGNPESIVAGLLKVRLGGINIYHGKAQYRAELGNPDDTLSPDKIAKCLKLISWANWSALIILLGFKFVIEFFK